MRRAHTVIGISTGFSDYGDYLGAVYSRPLARHGAIPIVLPYAERAAEREALLAHVDGVILGVGRDVDPQRYGGVRHPSSTAHSPLRDAAEIALTRDALAAGVPLLGICRGMQVINIALGGTLHPDHSVLAPPGRHHPGGDWERWERVVDATVQGTESPAHPSHPIEIASGCWLAEALGSDAVVNSYHHQSIALLGDGVRATARAPDGVIESIEVPDRAFCLGVQWELQEECAPGGNGERILRLFLRHAARCRRTRLPPHAGSPAGPGVSTVTSTGA
jgi:putative glutamine amidotransferase